MHDTFVTDLLGDKKKSLIEVYLELQLYYEQKYGPQALVMMEVGSFFEVYGVDNETEKIGKPKEIADILNIQLTRKNKTIKENSAKNPLMAGFPSAAFDRYIERLVKEETYTIIIIRQKGTPPNIDRYVETILSPGIHVDYHLDTTENFVASILIDRHQGLYSVGYAAIDVTTGKTYLAESHSTKDDPTYALDELFRLLQTHHTSEIILTPLSPDIDVAALSEYLETPHIHHNTKRAPIKYQNELFKRAYIVQSFLSPIEWLDLEREPLTSESLAIVIEFIIEHDHNVIAGLSKPTHITAEHYVYLGNNPLEQLNIISRDPHEYTIIKHMDKTVTSMGKRLFKNRLLNPITDADELTSRYDLVDLLSPYHTHVRATLRSMYDLERINRRIKLGKLHPYEINFLLDSLESASLLADELKDQEHTVSKELLHKKQDIIAAKSYIEQTFDTDRSSKFLQSAIDESFFQEGVSPALDTLTAELRLLESKLHEMKCTYESLLEKSTGKEAPDCVDICQRDKDGHHIQMTKSRYYLIQPAIKETYLSIDGTVYALSDFSYKIQTNTVKITAPIIDTISESIVLIQKKIIAVVKELYQETLLHIATHYGILLDEVSLLIARIDIAQSQAKTKELYHMTRPELVMRTDDETSHLSLHDVRHPLVEAKEEYGIYVPNTVILGEMSYQSDADLAVSLYQDQQDTRGLLLYGINSSGKSSLMKSIGVSIILAQSGSFVPATAMRFTPVRELFTRIVAKDNFEKGLSSFAVEMSELKNIFNRATPQSLILGDEISHGTETLSAIAIVSATILRMIEVQSLFVFTTHLHQIMEVPSLQTITHVLPVHLAVHNDETKDCLIFDRTLQPGSGSSIYGLEFAQSIHMDETFLTYAKQIRKELAGEFSELELLTKRQTSKYNKQVYLTTCALCPNPVDDTHHIKEQHTANEHGNIDHMNKNHAYNLLPICKSCHDAIHAGHIRIQGFVMTSKGVELRVEIQKEE